jgi:peptide/nickel transport system substrate-binding protein
MKFLFYISIFILSIISLFSCKTEKEIEQINQKIFRYNELEFVKNLHPLSVKNEAERRVVHQIFNGLWRLENDGNFYPSLADSTKQVDSLTWEFVLKPNIQLHSTSTKEVLTSKDVVESLTNWAKKENKNDTDEKLSTQTQIFKEIIGNDYEKAFEIINEHKFRIHLQIPFSPLIKLLSCTESLIVPNKSSRLGDKFSPVGSGAFYIHFFDDNQKIILKKNQNYFHKTIKLDTLPLLDEIHVSFLQNPEYIADKILNNELDWLPSTQQTQQVLPFIIQKEKEIQDKNKADKSENQSKRFVSKFIQIDSFPILQTAGFEIQISDTSITDLRANYFTIQSFRQALNMAIYREEFKKIKTFSSPAHEGIFPNILPKNTQNEANGYYFHPQTSIDILQKIGFDSTTFIKIFAEKKDTLWVNLARKQWKSIGIKSILYLDNINKNKADLIATTFKASFADESFLFWKYFDRKSYDKFLIEKEGFLEFEKTKTNQNDSVSNFQKIDKTDLFSLKKLRFDSLFIEYLKQESEIERELLSNQLKNKLIRSSPFIEIFYLQTHQIRRSYIAELVPNALGIYHFDRLDKSFLEPAKLIREDYMYEEKSVTSEQ